MEQWLVKKGNTSVQEVPVYDKAGVLVKNLADAAEIKFQIKEKKDDAIPKVEKTLISGIVFNTPLPGYLQITLLPTDTEITPKKYYMGLEIKWSADEIYEVIIMINGAETEVFEIEQDIVLPVAP